MFIKDLGNKKERLRHGKAFWNLLYARKQPAQSAIEAACMRVLKMAIMD